MLADQQHDVSAVNLCKWGLEELEVQHPASRISHLASEKLQMKHLASWAASNSIELRGSTHSFTVT
jgi:cell division protein FtsL